ncbi:hypothetical protein BBJ28_00022247, partial [Nothophytophthora sp. Chile5]
MAPSGYGAVDFDAADECDAFGRIGNPRSRSLWGTLVLGAVGLAAVGYAATVHSSLAAQQELIARMQQQLYEMQNDCSLTEALHSAVVVDNAAVSDSKTTSHKDGKFPTKFAVDYVTPLKTQDERGTCWDFATIGVLENSYRQQGIANGWLEEDEYMAISEQAYGEEVIRLCAGPPGSPQKVACFIPDNSTEGGEVVELLYLMNGLKDNIYPHSLCPYIPDPGSDASCPGLTLEKRTTNPLSLSIKKMDSYYDAVSVKRALLKDRRAMAISTSMPYITHYYPCIGDLAGEERCNPASTSCT